MPSFTTLWRRHRQQACSAKAKIYARQPDRRYGLERFMAETKRLYGVMDRRLADHAFFAGEEISIADFAIVGWVWRHDRHKVDLVDFPHVRQWYLGMMERPGVARGFGVALKRAT